MELSYYKINETGYVDLFFDNNRQLRVHVNEFSGKVYARKKINSVFGVDHTGLYIGLSECQEHIVIHNHYKHGRATITTWDDFAARMDIFERTANCQNTPTQRVSIALDKVLDREAYNIIDYSCQSLTNMACNNTRRHDDTGKVLGKLAISLGLLVLAGAALSK